MSPAPSERERQPPPPPAGPEEAPRHPETLVATRALVPELGSSLDPRVEEITWLAYRVTAARQNAIASGLDVSEALRGLSDILERTWDPGRVAALTRVSSSPDASGRASLELSVGIGVLGPKGETASDALRAAPVVEGSLARFPSPFSVEQTDASLLIGEPPPHLAAIRQRWVEVSDDVDTIRVPSRFDRQVESWLEVADLLVTSPGSVVLQVSLLSTTLVADDAMLLQQDSVRAHELRARALEAGNPVLAGRATRIVETLVDLFESFSGTLWVAEVLVGSDSPLSRPLIRSLGASVSNELDVVHVDAAAPVVAGRRRIVGGFEIDERPVGASEAMRFGLPSPALRGRTLADCFSITEAGLCFRWPIPAGRPIPTIPSGGSQGIPAPSGLPVGGLRVGRDHLGNDVHLGPDGVRTHVHSIGATGSGKSTFIRLCIAHDLEIDRPFVLIDPHGDLSRAVRADAGRFGRAIAVIDADERETVALDLLDGACHVGGARRTQLDVAVSRVIDALTSHFPRDWAGPRFRQLARAILGVLVALSDRFSVGLVDAGPLFHDNELLTWALSQAQAAPGADVLARHLREQDSPGTGLWAASKFEDVAGGPGAARIFAPFGEGLSVGEVIDAGIPLVVNLSAGRLSRLASRLLGQVVLASTIDYALGRAPGDRRQFAVYVDEAHRFPAVNLVDALAETRKYGVSLVLAHQQLAQLDDELAAALLANAGIRVMFRTGIGDGRILSTVTGVPAADLAGASDLSAYVHMAGRAPFSVTLEPPAPVPDVAAYRRPEALRRPESERRPGLREAMAAAEGLRRTVEADLWRPS